MKKLLFLFSISVLTICFTVYAKENTIEKKPNNENAIGMLKKPGYQENEQNVVYIILDYYISWVLASTSPVP